MTGNGEEVRCATWGGVHVGGLGSQVTNVRCKIHFDSGWSQLAAADRSTQKFQWDIRKIVTVTALV